MDEKGRDRRDDARNKGAGIRVPAPGESSSSGMGPPLDSPTIIDIPARKLPDISVRRITADAPTVIGGPSTPKPGSGQINVYAGTISEV